MDDKSRMKVKMWLIVIGVAIIGYIFAVSIRMNMVKQPQGEYMRLQDGTGGGVERINGRELWGK